MRYVARGGRVKGFVLADENEHTLGTVSYSGWISRKAQLGLYTGDTYSIVPANFWITAFDVLQAEVKMGEIKIRLTGKNEIIFNNRKYQYNRTGFWQQTFTLYDDAGYEIVAVRQRYDWRRFGFIYEIDVDAGFQSPDILPLMLIIVYITNVQYARAGGS